MSQQAKKEAHMSQNKDTQILEKCQEKLKVTRVIGSKITAFCPKHEETKPSLHIDLAKGLFHCFGCGYGGRITKLIQDLGGDASGIEFEYSSEDLQLLSTEELLALTQFADRWAMDIDKGMPFIEEKWGISETTIRKLGIGYLDSKSKVWKGIKSSWWARSISLDPQGELDRLFETSVRLGLVDEKGKDKLHRQMIVFPYQYDGYTSFINCRLINPNRYKYYKLKGSKLTQFFNDQSIDEYDYLYLVEGEANCAKLFDIGIKNVISLRSATQRLTEYHLESLTGKAITIIYDNDDSGNKGTLDRIGELGGWVNEIYRCYMLRGLDICEYLKRYPVEQFKAEVLDKAECVYEYVPEKEYVVIPQKKTSITLEEAHRILDQKIDHIANNKLSYVGKKILNKFEIRSGKTHTAGRLSSCWLGRVCILVPQHVNADEWIREHLPENLKTVVKLEGRERLLESECPYLKEYKNLIRRGFSRAFQIRYCVWACGKGRKKECSYYKMLEEARSADILIAQHSHLESIPTFLTLATYGNHRRSLFIIDERCKPIKEKSITLEDVVRNKDLMLDIIHKFAKQEGLFEDIGLPAKGFYDLLGGIEKAIREEKDYEPREVLVSGKELYQLEKQIAFMVEDFDFTLLVNDLAYIGKTKTRLRYEKGVMKYVQRPILPPRAFIMWLSAISTRPYLENLYQTTVDEVIGEQFAIQRPKDTIVQMINIRGGRRRVLGERRLRENLIKAVKEICRKEMGKKIAFVTYKKKKNNIIDLFQPNLEHRLMAIDSSCVEDIALLDESEIPVINYGLVGINTLADYDVLVELTGFFYNSRQIKRDIQIEYGDRPFEMEVKEIEYVTSTGRVEKKKMWVYVDPDVNEYLRNNQVADLIQTEGRVLRGDKPKAIYRFHSELITPAPTFIPRSWVSFHKWLRGEKDKQLTKRQRALLEIETAIREKGYVTYEDITAVSKRTAIKLLQGYSGLRTEIGRGQGVGTRYYKV